MKTPKSRRYRGYLIKPRGGRWDVRPPRDALHSLDGGWTVNTIDEALATINDNERDPSGKRRTPKRKRNSSMTKTQRKAQAKKTSAKRRVAKALQHYLRQLNPGKKFAGARVKKNKGGSITIIPVKLPKSK